MEIELSFDVGGESWTTIDGVNFEELEALEYKYVQPFISASEDYSYLTMSYGTDNNLYFCEKYKISEEEHVSDTIDENYLPKSNELDDYLSKFSVRR